jgi:hypothetical protein
MMLPKLVRFLLTHAANGMAGGCALLFGLIGFDVGGLRGLLAGDASGLATFLLFFQTMLTFGAAWMGIAVMGLRRGRD